MASINMSQGTASGKGPAALYQKQVRISYKLIDLMKATTSKGSALAAADVIQAIAIPANSAVLFAGCRVLEVADMQGDTKFKLGLAASDAAYVGSGVGSLAGTFIACSFLGTYCQTATNLNVTIQSWSGSTPTTGVLAVFAGIADLMEFAGSNINATTNLVGDPQD